jgi:hypothetical protein
MSFAFALAMTAIAIQDMPGLLSTVLDRPILLIFSFVCYGAVVNAVASIISQDPEPLIHTLYYLQVVIGCIVVQHVLRTEVRAPQIVYWSIWTALVLQALALSVLGIGEGRATLFFGNPNQLSLFALLALAYLLLLHSTARASGVVLAIGMATAVALILVSLSKAAMVSAVVMLALSLLYLPVRIRWMLRMRPIAIVVLPIAVVVFFLYFRDELALVNTVLDRLADIGISADDSLTGRGYSRILEWPQYLLFGAGEGLTERFGVRFEIHSMFGTLLFSYGLPGVMLVLALLTVTARRAPKQFIILFVPVLLYSMTHHPMRQPMLWALLLFIGASPRIDRQIAGCVR